MAGPSIAICRRRKGRRSKRCGRSVPVDNARSRILSRIRRSQSKADEAARVEAVEKRLENPHCNIVPERGQGDEAHRIAVFQRMMEDVGGTVEILDDINDVPASVSQYLRNTNRPARIRHGSDEVL